MLKKHLENYKVSPVKITNQKYTQFNDRIGQLLNPIPIYVINLRKDLFRRSYLMQLFKRHQINYTLILVDNFKYACSEDTLTSCIHPSKLGCILSHMWCIQDALTNNHKRFLIFEDDIIFHKQFADFFHQIAKLPEYETIDLLMLGALDTRIDTHLQSSSATDATSLLYYPSANVLGAHANLYKYDFAKAFFEMKLNAPKILEFDYDYHLFMNSHKIAVCNPNLVVCELSTTNINHNFSPLRPGGFDRFKRFFQTSFTYNDYEYMIIAFIEFVFKKHTTTNPSCSFSFSCLDDALLQFQKETRCINMAQIVENIQNSGYTINDILDIIKLVQKNIYL